MHSIEMILALHRLGAIQFGQYELKHNFFTPFQIDLTPILSEPEIACALCESLWMKAHNFSFDLICGLPTLGTLFAGFISWKYGFPMVVKRFQRKEGLQILGKYKSGQKCLILQDVLGFGTEALNFSDTLKAEGLNVVDTVALIDLQVADKKRLKTLGIFPHSAIRMQEILETLLDHGKISGDHFKLSTDFLENVSK